MKISRTWLATYVDCDWTPEEFTDRLTMAGLEVEAHEDVAAPFNGFVVGRVVTRDKHPNADRLSVCTVDVGTEQLQIVCGAPNVAAGQKVAVGLVGATVPHDQHDPAGKPFVLSKVKIRGVASSGMICSAKELGLGVEGDGILVLDPSAEVGKPLAAHLGREDVVYEVGITPNRPDCLSHLGVAREVSMLNGKPVRLPRANVDESGPASAKLARIEIQDPDLCPRYAGRVLSGVTVGPSPAWLQERLSAVGVRPINVVVDVTNFVMLEYGQPLHAFDLDRLAGASIVVRRAGTDASFTTLDGKRRPLKSDMLMICDAEKPVAVAGVMGGENSEISDSTKRILIESAYFQPSSIRRTARDLGLSTEASYRFERGADPSIMVEAADRAAHLLQELTGAVVHPGTLDEHPRPYSPPSVALRVARTNAILGSSFTADTVSELLRRIGVKTTVGPSGVVTAVPPSWRVDLTTEIDLVEEVARVNGYDRIEAKTKAAIDLSTAHAPRQLSEAVRERLIGGGFQEIVTISLMQERLAELEGRPFVRVLNPVSAEMQVLRTGLIPPALEVVRSNHRYGNTMLRLFEVGSVFTMIPGADTEDLGTYKEEERVSVVMSGDRRPVSFDEKPRGVDLFDLKGELEAMLGGLCLDKYRFIPYDGHNTLAEWTVGIEINGTYAGWYGKVRREVAERFEIELPVFAAELSIEAISKGWTKERKYRPLPKFPSVARDLAFVVRHEVAQGTVAEAIRASAGPLLEALNLFDAYEGAQAGPGNKSLAYALTFRAPDHTLTDVEVDGFIRTIVAHVHSVCGAVLRS